MGMSVIGALRVMLGMDTAEFEQGADSAARGAKRVEKDMKALGANLQKIGAGMTAAVTAPLVAFGVSAVEGFVQQEKALADVNAALTSMGNSAGRSLQQLNAAADAMEMKSLFDGDVILKQVTANLLTFGNVAGKEFDRAQQAALDMATRLGGEPQQAAIMLGKALNDPVKGISALTRVGVQFTEQQKAQIKAMTEAGNAAGAQGVILAEVERQFAGAAAAAADASPWRALEVQFGRLGDAVGGILLPALKPIADAAANIAGAFANMSPAMQTVIVVIGAVAAAAGPMLLALGTIITLAPAIATGFAAVSAAALPIAAVVAGVAAAGYLIYENWDQIAPVLDKVGAAFDATIGEDLRQIVDEASAKLTALWEGPFGEAIRVVSAALIEFQFGYAKVLGEGLMRVLDAAVTLVGGAFNAMLDAVSAVSLFLSGDFSGAWRAVKDLVVGVGSTIAGVIDALFPGLVQLGKDIIAGIVAGIKSAPRAVLEALFSVVNPAVAGIKEFLGIKSPSLLFMGIGSNIAQGLANGILSGTGPVAAAMQSLGDQAEIQTVRVAQTFADMADGAINAMQRLSSAVKGGGFLDILGALIGVGTQLGQMGAFGKTIQKNLASTVPGLATGGTMRLGGVAGIDRNLLSLNGSPIARVSAGEMLTVSPANDRGAAGGSLNVTVTMDASTGALGAFVRDAAGQVIAQATPQIVAAGAQAAAMQSAKAARWTYR